MRKEDIILQFARYVGRELSIEALGEWLLSHLQQVLDSDDQEAVSLVDEADALLVELSNKDISELDFFNRLAAIVSIESTIPVSISFYPGYWVTPAAPPSTRDSASTSRGYPNSDQISLSFG